MAELNPGDALVRQGEDFYSKTRVYNVTEGDQLTIDFKNDKLDIPIPFVDLAYILKPGVGASFTLQGHSGTRLVNGDLIEQDWFPIFYADGTSGASNTRKADVIDAAGIAGIRIIAAGGDVEADLRFNTVE